jgi:hypothetical protein
MLRTARHHLGLPPEYPYPARVKFALFDAKTVEKMLRKKIRGSDAGPMTEFTVAVYRNPTEHKIRLGQVAKWAEPTTKDGPAGITKRERVRALLSG